MEQTDTSPLPAQIQTVDRHTLRPITWNVVHVSPAPSDDLGRSWTHFVGLQRPKGRRGYCMWAVVDDSGAITRHSDPIVAF